MEIKQRVAQDYISYMIELATQEYKGSINNLSKNFDRLFFSFLSVTEKTPQAGNHNHRLANLLKEEDGRSVKT